MKRILVLGLLLPFFSPAFAQMVFKSESFMVLFFGTPCEVPQIAVELAAYGKPMRAVVVTSEGYRVAACYAKDEDGEYLLADVLNNSGRIPGKQVNPGA